MRTVEVAVSAVIEAPPGELYAIIADYRNRHPRILSRKHFPRLEVERGGIGAGTRIRFQMRLVGRIRTLRAEIHEPEPGRVLVERNLDPQAAVTTFTVEPLDGGRRAAVTIATRWESGGARWLVERALAPRLLRPVFEAQLGNLARAACAPPLPG